MKSFVTCAQIHDQVKGGCNTHLLSKLELFLVYIHHPIFIISRPISPIEYFTRAMIQSLQGANQRTVAGISTANGGANEG